MSGRSTTIVGVDVGGTGIKGGPVDLAAGQLVGQRVRIPTPHPATPDAVAGVVNEVLEAIGVPGPVGITLPSVIRDGVVETAANIDPSWIGVHADELFGSATTRPVGVVNDADAAGIAEMGFGAGRGRPGAVLVVTLGTGIGSALFVDGALVPNSELGHLPLHGVEAERWAADSVRVVEELTWKKWARRLEVYLQLVERLLWPQLIIVGGGVSKRADKFLPLINLRTEIVPAQLANNAGIVGAALFVPPAAAPSPVGPTAEVKGDDVTTIDTDLDRLAVNVIRGLCMDAVQAANSGHPGTPMGMAPVAYTLWQRFLRFDPADPIWPNRDRFVLSEGHASTLLWSLLHLSAVQAVDPDYEVLGQPAVTLDDLRTFRQLDSKCPGHPEYRWTSGVETTTGPLGQGVATSVGMAVAGQWLAARYNKDGFELFDFNVYALAGDGCMMEGVSSEAASFAGHQRLSNLCWIYDSNRVTIEGHTDIAFTEDVAARFLAYDWNVTTVADANDLDAVSRAFHTFEAEHERPTLILVHSHIGYGSPVEDSPKAHGEPFGPDGVRATKRFLGLPEDEDFFVPQSVYADFAQAIGARGAAGRAAWETLYEGYRAAYPELADELDRLQRRDLPERWETALPTFPADEKGMASRESDGHVLNALAERIPWVVGGSADLSPSTKTNLTFAGAGDFQPDSRSGRNLHFGVREHASAAIANGMALTKLRSYWSGFLIFSDYARGAIRLSALMEIPVVHIFTHDSIGVGEDGPTHQPVEQVASLRAMPGLLVFRPGDANEVTETWRVVAALHREPAVLVLSRQALRTFDRSTTGPAAGVARGAYVLADAPGTPDVILLATGSEVQLAMAARHELAAEGLGVRVVSMPCWELFDRQPVEYRHEVLPPAVKARVAVEQASTFGWDRYVGDGGTVIGMHTFGASAPLKNLLTKFGFTPEKVAQAARERIAAAQEAR